MDLGAGFGFVEGEGEAVVPGEGDAEVGWEGGEGEVSWAGLDSREEGEAYLGRAGR